jgi:chromosomal replication initiator protein
MEATFEKVKVLVKKRVPAHTFNMWIEPISFNSASDHRLVLEAPNFFIKKRFQNMYADLVNRELKKISGKTYKIQIIISGKTNTIVEQKATAPTRQHQLPLPEVGLKPYYGRLLRRDFTFDQFVVSGNNDFAYTAALSQASQKSSANHTLMLLSGAGMGKSHLSQAIGHHILAKKPTDKVFYMTADDFTSEVVQAYRNNSISQFKQKYRSNCDFLVLEDVHFLSGKEKTQSELAATLDSLADCGKGIIFTSCCTPREIPKMSDQLKSRLSAGLVTHIDPPNFRTRVRILEKKAAAQGILLPMDVTHYLSEALSEDVRQLESGLIGIAAKSSLLGKPIDLALAESVIKSIIKNKSAVTIEAIKKLVSQQFSITVKDMISKSRKQGIIRPRQIAMYLSRRHTDAPLQTIGKNFNRYHATALHSINFVESALKQNGPIKKQVTYLEKKLEKGDF